MRKADDLLRRTSDIGLIAGAVGLATARGGPSYAGAFGTRSSVTTASMSQDTIFEVTGLLRPLLAVAVLQLVDAGLLGLDDPVRAVLPELAAAQVLDRFDRSGAPVRRPATRHITLRHLLTHTAGLNVGSGWNGAPREDGWAKPYRPSATLLADPGHRWLHCADTDLIAKVIERLSGLSLAEYLRDGICRELGMPDTGFGVAHQFRDRVAGGWRDSDEGVPQFHSTPRDYVKFVEAMLWRDESLLSREAFELLRDNQIGALTVPKVVDLASVRTPGDINIYPEMRLYPDTEAQWSLGFMLNTQDVPDGPRAGTQTSAGNSHTFCWIDPRSEMAGLVFIQPALEQPVPSEPLLRDFQRSLYAEREARLRRRRIPPHLRDSWAIEPLSLWWLL